MSACNRLLKTYTVSQDRFTDGSIMLFKPIMSFYKS